MAEASTERDIPPAARLEVTAPLGTEIFLIDGRLGMVGRAIDALQLNPPAGPYKVRFRLNGEVGEILLALRAGAVRRLGPEEILAELPVNEHRRQIGQELAAAGERVVGVPGLVLVRPDDGQTPASLKIRPTGFSGPLISPSRVDYLGKFYRVVDESGWRTLTRVLPSDQSLTTVLDQTKSVQSTDFIRELNTKSLRPDLPDTSDVLRVLINALTNRTRSLSRATVLAVLDSGEQLTALLAAAVLIARVREAGFTAPPAAEPGIPGDLDGAEALQLARKLLDVSRSGVDRSLMLQWLRFQEALASGRAHPRPEFAVRLRQLPMLWASWELAIELDAEEVVSIDAFQSNFSGRVYQSGAWCVHQASLMLSLVNRLPPLLAAVVLRTGILQRLSGDLAVLNTGVVSDLVEIAKFLFRSTPDRAFRESVVRTLGEREALIISTVANLRVKLEVSGILGLRVRVSFRNTPQPLRWRDVIALIAESTLLSPKQVSGAIGDVAQKLRDWKLKHDE